MVGACRFENNASNHNNNNNNNKTTTTTIATCKSKSIRYQLH